MKSLKQILEGLYDVSSYHISKAEDLAHKTYPTGSYSSDHKRLNHLERMEKPLTDHYQFKDSKVTNERGVVRTYTSGSSDVNSYLHEKHKASIRGETPEHNEDHEEYISKLDNVLAKHETPKAMTLYSGVKMNPAKIKNEEGIIHHPAYMSTSIDKNRGISFGKDNSESITGGGGSGVVGGRGKVIHNVLAIHVPKGSQGAYVNHISSVSGEHEFILPRGSNLKHNHTSIERHELPKMNMYNAEHNHEGNIKPIHADLEVHTHHVTLMPQKKLQYKEERDYSDNLKKVGKDAKNDRATHKALSRPGGGGDFMYHFLKTPNYMTKTSARLPHEAVPLKKKPYSDNYETKHDQDETHTDELASAYHEYKYDDEAKAKHDANHKEQIKKLKIMSGAHPKSFDYTPHQTSYIEKHLKYKKEKVKKNIEWGHTPESAKKDVSQSKYQTPHTTKMKNNELDSIGLSKKGKLHDESNYQIKKITKLKHEKKLSKEAGTFPNKTNLKKKYETPKEEHISGQDMAYMQGHINSADKEKKKKKYNAVEDFKKEKAASAI